MKVERKPVDMQPDVVMTLTYVEAQFLRGIVNFFQRTAQVANFRGSLLTYTYARTVAARVDDLLGEAGVAHHRSDK